MQLTIEYEQEDDGRWLAEVLELPGTLTYGQSPEEAVSKAKALTLRVIAEQIEHGERDTHDLTTISFAAA
jgi:predicted RNase H-like HicB family nuclease